MCGHFGMMGGGIVVRDLTNFENLGIISQIRGRDGAGVFRISTTNTNWTAELLLKSGEDFCNLLYDVDSAPRHSPNANLLTWTTPNLFMGHVRARTKGPINTDNAHPFSFPNLVGAHNGTLKDKRYESNTQTDSELMFADMNERGVLPVLRDLDEEGAYAIVVYDRRTRKVNFARNTKRPFWMAFLHNRDVMYWASEPSMLELVLDRNNEAYSLYSLRPNVVWEIDPAGIRKENEKKLTALGVISQKFEDERKAKEEAEKAKKAEEEAKKQEVKTDLSSPFLPFNGYINPAVTKITEPSWHVFCDCGKLAMELADSIAVRNGTKFHESYNVDTDTFKCEGCPTVH